jgi:hypothetical protein
MLDHTLKRNNYPDTVFNHDLSFALEAAGLPFIGDDCFPCDPERATCNTLHFFTIFLRWSSAIPERPKRIFCPSFCQGRRRSGIEQSYGKNPIDDILRRFGR